MNEQFWVALVSVLTAAAGLLTAIRQRITATKVKAKATADEQLARERRESLERERKAAVDALEFRERLRQEAISERGILEDRLEDLANALREATSVMERSTALAERVLDAKFVPSQRGAAPRKRAADRPAPRRGVGTFTPSRGRSSTIDGTE